MTAVAFFSLNSRNQAVMAIGYAPPGTSLHSLSSRCTAWTHLHDSLRSRSYYLPWRLGGLETFCGSDDDPSNHLQVQGGFHLVPPPTKSTTLSPHCLPQGASGPHPLPSRRGSHVPAGLSPRRLSPPCDVTALITSSSLHTS